MKEVLNKQYNGQTPSRSKSSFWNGTIDWLTSGELNRSIVTRTNEKITSNGQKDANLKIIPKGTFVIAITGLEAVGTRGNCALLGIDTTLNQSCMALFTDEKKLSPKFLFQWYRKYGNEYGIRYTQGTKQQSYNAEIINKLPINLPALKEQKVINFLLSKVDIAITLQQRQLDSYNKLKKGLLQKLFPKDGEKVPEVRFADFTGNWEQHKLDKVLVESLDPGTNGLESNKLSVKLWGKGVIRKSENYKGSISTKYYKRSSGQIIYGKLDFLHGAFGIIPTELDGYESTIDSPSFNVNKNCNSDFLLDIFIQESFYLKNGLIANGSRKAKRINEKTFLNMSIFFPKRIEQDKISELIKKISNLITLQQEKMNELEALKKYLLQKLFI